MKDPLAPTGNGAGIRGTQSGGIFGLPQAIVVEYVDNRPLAAFTANETCSATPLSIQFTDASMGMIITREWDFENDGIVDSSTENPIHQYTASGIFTVKLTVTGPDGSDDEVKEHYIVANLAPLPGFIKPPTDPDGDGLYENLNANRIRDLNDIVRFYKKSCG